MDINSMVRRWWQPALYVIAIILLISGYLTRRNDPHNSRNLLIATGVIALVGWAYNLKDQVQLQPRSMRALI